uniref:G_PROTEIN_RECEP_F1_2 domain-containing protein n=1 Tax=Caenorhabditis tropicalis TaxID=1561998 RepID=A0A1I7UGR8_9PELO
MSWFLGQWFEALIAKLVILPYQMGSRGPPVYGWWTSEIAQVKLAQNEVIPLFLASWVLWHYIYSMMFSLVAFVIERLWATVLIEDYEHVPRRHIPILLILLTNLITIPYSYFIVNYRIPFWIAFGQCVVNGVFVVCGYVAFWRFNLFLKGREGKYSLARKFQIEENIRSFQLAFRMVIAAALYLSVALFILVLVIFKVFQGFEPYLDHLFDTSRPNPKLDCHLVCALLEGSFFESDAVD